MAFCLRYGKEDKGLQGAVCPGLRVGARPTCVPRPDRAPFKSQIAFGAGRIRTRQEKRRGGRA